MHHLNCGMDLSKASWKYPQGRSKKPSRALSLYKEHIPGAYFPTNMGFHMATRGNTFLNMHKATSADEEHFLLFPRPTVTG